jgi:hypothetical protein
MSAFAGALARRRRIGGTANIVRADLIAAIFLSAWPATVYADDLSTKNNPSNTAAANPLAEQSLQALSATLKRPLFAPSRRAPAPNTTPIARSDPPPQPPPEPAVTLLGTIVDGQSSQAILRADGVAKDRHVRLGDDVDGWKVVDIGEQHLSLALNDRTLSVALFPDKPAAPVQRSHQGSSAKRRAASDAR